MKLLNVEPVKRAALLSNSLTLSAGVTVLPHLQTSKFLMSNENSELHTPHVLPLSRTMKSKGFPRCDFPRGPTVGGVGVPRPANPPPGVLIHTHKTSPIPNMSTPVSILRPPQSPKTPRIGVPGNPPWKPLKHPLRTPQEKSTTRITVVNTNLHTTVILRTAVWRGAPPSPVPTDCISDALEYFSLLYREGVRIRPRRLRYCSTPSGFGFYNQAGDGFLLGIGAFSFPCRN